MSGRALRLATGIALLLAALITSAAIALGVGGEVEPRAEEPPPAGTNPPVARTPARPPAAAPARPLELGLTEFTPALVAPGPAPRGFGPWRDAAAALRPDRFRLVVDWTSLQPDPNRPADLAEPRDGCGRGAPPCAAYAGIRDMLRALAARQREDGGWEVVVVLAGVPEWAARPPGGCERPTASPRARPFSEAGRRGYQELIRRLWELGKREGVELRWWSPWNEPNHPAFVSPQRPVCDPAAPAESPAVYADMVRLAAAALEGTGAKLVLGELAGFRRPTPSGTGVAEFVRALPDDVACRAAAWAQHEYASPEDERRPPFSRDAVAEVQAALDERPCTREVPIWVTETGVGGARAGDERATRAHALARQCAAQAARLERWADDPRVTAVFQYLFREDRVYPVGLADPELRVLYPTHALWLAWAGARGEAAPERPAGCGARA